MKVVLWIAAILCFIVGAFLWVFFSKSAIHEIEALMMHLIGFVCLVGAGVLSRLERIASEIGWIRHYASEQVKTEKAASDNAPPIETVPVEAGAT